MERVLDWTGLLIEGNPLTFKKLKARKRNAWISPVCLSLDVFLSEVKFQPKSVDPGHSHIDAEGTLQKPRIERVDPESVTVTVQCFPLYSEKKLHFNKIAPALHKNCILP